MKTFDTDHLNRMTRQGYAEFNRCNHVAIDVPDGQTTYSFRTSEGKRLTFCFLPYIKEGPPQCVDVAYHDSGVDVMTKSGEPMPAMHAILWTGGREHDTRQSAPVAFATLLIEDRSYQQKEGA